MNSHTRMARICPRKNMLVTWLIGAAAVAIVSSCATLPKTQEEAASTHLAVLSVARWEDYAAHLQPKFELSAADAFNAALPTTLNLEEKLMSAFAARFKVALPGTTFSSTDLSTLAQMLAGTNSEAYAIAQGVAATNSSGGSATGNSSSSQQSNSETSASGDISKISFGDSPAGTRTAASLPSTGVLTNSPKSDAMLRYWAAAALFQEVNLINRYVKDAAIADDYVPYVVRLQVSIMPRKRDLPYDAYTLLSFFAGKFQTSSGRDTHHVAATAKTPAGDGSENVVAAKANQNIPAPQEEGIRVLPLLVTDNIESALHSRAVDNMRQLALGLSAIVSGVGLGADLQHVNEELRTVLGYDFNSTFTVGRVSDNTVQCRFGALNQAAERFAMIPQTHNVTLLILVPRKASKPREPLTRDLRVISKTELVHVASGDSLSASSRKAYHKKTRAVLEKYGFEGKAEIAGPKISEILKAVAANEFKTFESILTNYATADTTKYYESIWVDLCQLRNSSQLGSAEFQVPSAKSRLSFLTLANAKEEQSLSATNQTISAVDNGKNLTVSLHWLQGVSINSLGALVAITGDQQRWPASAIEVQNEGRFVRLTFPSPAGLGYTNANGSTAFVLNLFSLDPDESFRQQLAGVSRLVSEEKPTSDKAGFEMLVRASVINAHKPSTNGIEGTIDVVVSEKSEGAKIEFEVNKADVVSILPPDKVKQAGRTWVLATNGTYTVQLRNLNPLEPVILSAKDASSKAGSFTWAVRVQQTDK